MTGVRAGTFLGYKGFLPEFPQTCPKNFCATFCASISHEDRISDDLQIEVFI